MDDNNNERKSDKCLMINTEKLELDMLDDKYWQVDKYQS